MRFQRKTMAEKRQYLPSFFSRKQKEFRLLLLCFGFVYGALRISFKLKIMMNLILRFSRVCSISKHNCSGTERLLMLITVNTINSIVPESIYPVKREPISTKLVCGCDWLYFTDILIGPNAAAFNFLHILSFCLLLLLLLLMMTLLLLFVVLVFSFNLVFEEWRIGRMKQ